MKLTILFIILSLSMQLACSCMHENCLCVEELRLMFCRNISKFSSLSLTKEFQVKQIIIEQSNITDTLQLQNYFPSLQYVKLINSTIDCSQLEQYDLYIDSNCNNIHLDQLPDTVLATPRLPNTFYAAFPKTVENTATSFLVLFMMCLINMSSIIGYIIWGRVVDRR